MCVVCDAERERAEPIRFGRVQKSHSNLLCCSNSIGLFSRTFPYQRNDRIGVFTLVTRSCSRGYFWLSPFVFHCSVFSLLCSFHFGIYTRTYYTPLILSRPGRCLRNNCEFFFVNFSLSLSLCRTSHSYGTHTYTHRLWLRFNCRLESERQKMSRTIPTKNKRNIKRQVKSNGIA